MKAFSSTGIPVRVGSENDSLTALALRFLGGRVGQKSSINVITVDAFSSAVASSQDATVKFESWSVIPSVPGTVGTVFVFHGQETPAGVPTLLLNVGADAVQYRPTISDGKWAVVNNTGSSVVVVVAWRENE